MEQVKAKNPKVICGDAEKALIAMKQVGKSLTKYRNSVIGGQVCFCAAVVTLGMASKFLNPFYKVEETKAKLCHMYDDVGRPFSTQRRISDKINDYKAEFLKASKTTTLSVVGLGIGVATIEYGANIPEISTAGFLLSLYSLGVGGLKASQEMSRASEARKVVEICFEDRYDHAKERNFQTQPTPNLHAALSQL